MTKDPRSLPGEPAATPLRAPRAAASPTPPGALPPAETPDINSDGTQCYGKPTQILSRFFHTTQTLSSIASSPEEAIDLAGYAPAATAAAKRAAPGEAASEAPAEPQTKRPKKTGPLAPNSTTARELHNRATAATTFEPNAAGVYRGGARARCIAKLLGACLKSSRRVLGARGASAAGS